MINLCLKRLKSLCCLIRPLCSSHLLILSPSPCTSCEAEMSTLYNLYTGLLCCTLCSTDWHIESPPINQLVKFPTNFKSPSCTKYILTCLMVQDLMHSSIPVILFHMFDVNNLMINTSAKHGTTKQPSAIISWYCPSGLWSLLTLLVRCPYYGRKQVSTKLP